VAAGACATLCFVTGVAFAYFVMMPTAITFYRASCRTLSSSNGPLASICRLSLTCFSGSACLSKLPLFVYFLAKLGIISYKTLWKNFKYAVIGIAVLAAAITPTVDPLNMALVMGPLILLYLLGITAGEDCLIVLRLPLAKEASFTRYSPESYNNNRQGVNYVPYPYLDHGRSRRDFHNFNVSFATTSSTRLLPLLLPRSQTSKVASIRLIGREPLPGWHPHPRRRGVVRPDLPAPHRPGGLCLFDVPHEYVMHKASQVLAAGADFRLMGTKTTWLASSKPVVAVCAVRTGAGKSQTTRHVCDVLPEDGPQSGCRPSPPCPMRTSSSRPCNAMPAMPT